MGVGAAASEPGTLSIIRHVYPEREPRARALGVWAAVAGLALAMGPVIGGVLVGLGGWRAVFWFNLAAGLIVLLAAARHRARERRPAVGPHRRRRLRARPGGARRRDLRRDPRRDHRLPRRRRCIALFVVSAAAALAFVVVEQRATPHLRPRYLLRAPFTGSLPVAFAAYFGIFSIFFFTALYLQVVVGYSAYGTAALFVPMAIAMIAASALTGAGWRAPGRACRPSWAAWRPASACWPPTSRCAAT